MLHAHGGNNGTTRALGRTQWRSMWEERKQIAKCAQAMASQRLGH